MTLGSNSRVIGEAFRKGEGLYQLNARVLKPEYTAYASEMPVKKVKRQARS